MKLTYELLRRGGANRKILKIYEQLGVSSIDFLDLLQEEDILALAHWCYEWISLSEEEQKAYFEKTNNKNSVGVRYSQNVTNSKMVVNSSDISNSETVYDSATVKQSNQIYDSEYVESSSSIWSSLSVFNSERVLRGTNITGSKEIVDSDCIISSVGVVDSTDIAHSRAVWKSVNLTNCGFCRNCSGLRHSLFCTNQKDDSYLIFNKPADETRFNALYKQFEELLSPQLRLIDSKKQQSPDKIVDIREHTGGIRESFWRWVETLPNYDEKILYSLTFVSREKKN